MTKFFFNVKVESLGIKWMKVVTKRNLTHLSYSKISYVIAFGRLKSEKFKSLKKSFQERVVRLTFSKSICKQHNLINSWARDF